MPKKYQKVALDELIKKLRKSRPEKKREKNYFSKKETLVYLTPTILDMRKRGFSYEEIVQKCIDGGVNVNNRDIICIHDDKQPDTPLESNA